MAATTVVARRITPATKHISGQPDKDWTLDKLKDYALNQMGDVTAFGRKTATAMFLMGNAFHLLSKKMKASGDWSTWQIEAGLNRGTVARAIRFYKAAKRIDKLGEDTFSEAWKRLCMPATSSDSPAADQKPASTSGTHSKVSGKGNGKALSEPDAIMNDLDDLIVAWGNDPSQTEDRAIASMERKLKASLAELEKIKAKRDKAAK
jgi:hypothetical protein